VTHRMIRHLILQRHAKSDWPVGVADLERPLSTRGVRDAPAAARWVEDNCPPVDLIIVSPAQRTRQTYDLIVAEWGRESMTIVDPRVYEARVSDLIDVVHDISDDIGTAMIIGHNPGLEMLAAEWPQTADRSASDQLATKFSTSAIATISMSGSWTDPQSRHLEQIVVPRGAI
jgi:phosphohistidine phosphatase